MTYENLAFPLTSGTSYNQYGVRETEDGLASGGILHGAGGQFFEAVFYVRDTDFTVASGAGTFDTRYTLPAGAIPTDAYFEVTEAFTQTGGTTSTTLAIGTNGTETTNGFSISDAATSLATTKELDTSGGGTWAAALATAAVVGVSLTAGGGAITAISAGRAKIVVRYRKV